MTKRLTWFLTVVLVLASTTWLASVSAQKPASADVLLGQALHQEQSEGRLEDAIATYRKVLSAPDATKAQKARAQFQIGACYERLGLGEARKAYEAVVRDYGDQGEFAAQARERLSALAPATAAQASPPGSLRRLYQATGVPGGVNGVTLSADARYAVIRLREKTEFLIRDLATGKERRVPYPSPDALATEWRGSSAGLLGGGVYSRQLSPDRSRIVYEVILTATIPGEKRFQTQVRLVNLDGTGARLVTKQDDTWITLLRWTADGQSVLARMESSANSFEFVSIRMSDGSVTRLSAAPIPLSAGDPLNGYLSPDARFIVEWGGGANNDGRSISVLDTRTGKRNRITDPIKGKDFQPAGWAPDGSGLVVVSAGAAWFVRLTDGVQQGAPELLRADAEGGAGPLDIGPDGSYYFRRRTQVARRYIATLDPATGRVNGTPVLMPEMQAACGYDWSPDGATIAFGAKMNKGTTDQNEPCTLLVIRSLADGRERVVSTGLSDIRRPRWSPNGKSLVVAGLRDGIVGAFRIDLDAGSARLLVASPANQRVDDSVTAAWTPDGKGLILARVDRNSDGAGTTHRIVHLDLETGTETARYAIANPGFMWFPTISVSRDGYVCAVISDTNGSRAAVIVPPDGGPARVVYRMPANQAFSGVSWSADGKALYVAQSTPGAGELNTRKLLRVPVDGGEPVDAGLSLAGLDTVQPSPDGKRLLLSTNEIQVEIWAIDRLVPTKAVAQAAPKK